MNLLKPQLPKSSLIQTTKGIFEILTSITTWTYFRWFRHGAQAIVFSFSYTSKNVEHYTLKLTRYFGPFIAIYSIVLVFYLFNSGSNSGCLILFYIYYRQDQSKLVLRLHFLKPQHDRALLNLQLLMVEILPCLETLNWDLNTFKPLVL